MQVSSSLRPTPGKRQRNVRRLIQCALTGAAVSLALHPHVSMATVTLSPYNSYDITQHADGGFANPDPGYGNVSDSSNDAFPLSDFEGGNYNSTNYGLITVDTDTDSTATPTFTYGSTVSLRQALNYANANGPAVIYFNSGGTDADGITSNIGNSNLDGANGPLIINNPNANIIMYSHNYGITQEASTGWPTGVNASLEVNAGSLLYYNTTNSPGYAEFPMSIGGTGSGNNSGHVQVYTVHSAGYGAGKQPIVDIINMSSYGTFQANRYLRLNLDTASTPLTMHDNSQLELGQHNTVYSDVDLYDNSTFISNGGNTFFYYGKAGDGSQNVLNDNLNLNNSSNAVFGYKTTITGNLNANDTSTVRLLGPSFVNGNATFASGSTIVATLNTPITDASDNAADSTAIGHPKVPDYSDSAYDPSNVGNTKALLTVGGTLTVNAGTSLVFDSVNGPLNVGDKYLVFTTTADPSFVNNFNYSTSLTPLTFSDLTEDPNNLNNYYVTIDGISFSNSFDGETGGNKEQRSFFNYVRDIAPQTNPGDVNSVLLYLYNNIGAGPNYNYDIVNQFLGDNYTAHAAQTYWNQQAFINTISDQLNTHSSTSGDPGIFSLNNNGLNGVQGQLSSLSQSLNSSALNLNGALDANGSNGGYRNGVWASAYGNRVNTKSSDSIGSPSWDGDTTGFAAGYTGGSEHFNWGVAAGHQKSDLSFNDRTAEGNLDGYNVGLYAALNNKHSYLTGILSYSHFNNDATRDDEIGANTSSFNSHGLAGQLEYGLHVHQTKTSEFTPYASLLWSNSETGDITETGTGAGLTIGSSSNSIETTQLGLRYNQRMYDKADNLKGGFRAGIAWVHQFGDTDFPMTAQFTGTTGSFDIYNTPLSSNAVQVQLGAYGRIHNSLVGFAGYQGTFGGNEHVNSVTGGIGYQF